MATVTPEMIQVAEAAREELANAVVPFGTFKDRQLRSLPLRELCMLADLAVRGDRDEYVIIVHKPMARDPKGQQHALWVVRFHYPLVLMARRYLYELRDLKFRYKIWCLKEYSRKFRIPDPSIKDVCFKCGNAIATREMDPECHHACWRDMLEEELAASRMA
jgi:hypothetical protein